MKQAEKIPISFSLISGTRRRYVISRATGPRGR